MTDTTTPCHPGSPPTTGRTPPTASPAPPNTAPGRPDVAVCGTAFQHRQGHIDTAEQLPLIVVDGASTGLTAKQARGLAMLLLEAANAMDALQ